MSGFRRFRTRAVVVPVVAVVGLLGAPGSVGVGNAVPDCPPPTSRSSPPDPAWCPDPPDDPAGAGASQRAPSQGGGLLDVLPDVLPDATSPSGPVGPLLDAVREVWVTELGLVPMEGAGWESLVTTVRGDLGDVDLSDQNSRSAGRTYGAALVYVRTGEAEYRDKVVAQLRRLPDAKTPPRRGGRYGGVLSVARQLSGYIMAAELVGYRDDEFAAFVDDIRDREIGGHGRWDAINATSEDSANNWGTWALATRAAASTYLDDQADIEQVASIFRRYTGESTEFEGWRPSNDFDPGWACTDPYVGINPAWCGDRAGAVVEDISRSSGSYPDIDQVGIGYSWEALSGAIVVAKLLHLAGYSDVYEWGDRALLRAAEFIHSHRDVSGSYPPRHDHEQHVPWAINQAYDVDLGPVNDAGSGWAFGFTDWTY
jgi:hypothetical protein